MKRKGKVSKEKKGNEKEGRGLGAYLGTYIKQPFFFLVRGWGAIFKTSIMFGNMVKIDYNQNLIILS